MSTGLGRSPGREGSKCRADERETEKERGRERENRVAQNSSPGSTGGLHMQELLCIGCYTEVLKFSPNCDDDSWNNFKQKDDLDLFLKLAAVQRTVTSSSGYKFIST